VLMVMRRVGMLIIAAWVVVSRVRDDSRVRDVSRVRDDSTWDMLQLTLKTRLVVLVG
jgi:hypothetical protein